MAYDDDNKYRGLVLVTSEARQYIVPKLRLDPRSRSRLNCQTLKFESYGAPQLMEILEKRVEQAFRPGSVDDAVIETIAERVSERGGDCRQALETLLRVGRQADRNGDSRVTPDDL